MQGHGASYVSEMDKIDINRLLERLNRREPGEFYFPDLYGSGWDDLFIGDKVKAGRNFMEAVRAGEVTGVEDTGRKQGRGRVYRWSGN